MTDKEIGHIVEKVGKDSTIEIKCGNAFLEYWRKPEATASEFTGDGWFKTGEVAEKRPKRTEPRAKLRTRGGEVRRKKKYIKRLLITKI